MTCDASSCPGPIVFGVCQCALSLLHPLAAIWNRDTWSWCQIIHVFSEQPAATENQAEDGTNVALCLFLCLLVLMQLDRERSGAGQDRRDSFSDVTKLKIAFGSIRDMEHFIQIWFFFCKVISYLGIFIHIIKVYIPAHV